MSDWQQEAARVAAAFGIIDPVVREVNEHRPCSSVVGRDSDGFLIECFWDYMVWSLWCGGSDITHDRASNSWTGNLRPRDMSKMANGLFRFRLSHPAYALLEQHGYGLTAHERLEAMLQMKEKGF